MRENFMSGLGRGSRRRGLTYAPAPTSRSQIWRPATRAAGLPEGVGLHALRRLNASLLKIRHGVDVKAVQLRLGHSSAAVTLDVYSHLWPDSDDRTREAVELALCSPADSARTGRRSS